MITCTYWPKLNANLNLVAFVAFVSNWDIDSLHSIYANGTMLNNCLCVGYLGLLAFETVNTVVKYHFQNVDIQCVKYLIHTFVCMLLGG